MEQEPDSLEQKKAILEYWTLVEFFSPYILENKRGRMLRFVRFD